MRSAEILGLKEASTAPAAAESPPVRSTAMINALIAAAALGAYVILEWLSFIHEYQGLPITPWNPGLGIMMALIVLAGARAGYLLFAGIILAEIFVLGTGIDWPTILAIATIISLGYSLAGVVVRRYLRVDPGLAHLRDVLLILAASLLAASLVTILLTALLILSGDLDVADAFLAAVPLSVGDVLGIAVMTPLLLRLTLRWRTLTLRRMTSLMPEAVVYAAVNIAGLWAIIGSGALEGSKFFYLFLLPVVAAAVRHGLDGACLGVAVTEFSLVGMLHLYGYDAAAFTEFQTLMFALTAAGLIVGVVVSERENADRLARQADTLLKGKVAEAAQAARFSLVSGMASALAHEINQPMTAARALARAAQHILKAAEPDVERAERNLASLIAQIDHAGEVVRHMRDFLRRGAPHVSSVEVRPVIEDAIALVHAEAAIHGVTIDIALPPVPPLVFGDRIQLQQVLINLIHNAVEAIAGAGRRSGRIRVSASEHASPSRIEIAVRDDGPGIDPRLAGRLFTPLTTSKHEGLGLGLSICASIIESHGGRIWLESGQPGETEFRFSLPLQQAGKA